MVAQEMPLTNMFPIRPRVSGTCPANVDDPFPFWHAAPHMESPPIQQQAIRWPDKIRGPWSLVFHWKDLDGRFECVGVEVWRGMEPHLEPRIDDAGATTHARRYRSIPGVSPEAVPASKISREIPFGSLIDSAREALSDAFRNVAEAARDSGMTGPADRLKNMAEKFEPETERSPGRPVFWDRAKLQEVAAVYIHAWMRNHAPRKAVADHFHVSPSAAAKLVARARKEGLLGETKRGRGGGILPPTTDEFAAHERMALASTDYSDWWPGAALAELDRAQAHADGELEIRAAHVLGEPDPVVVAVLAHRLWGQSLSAEWEQRVAAATSGRTAGRKGAVTRALFAELKELHQRVLDGEPANWILVPGEDEPVLVRSGDEHSGGGFFPLHVPGTAHWVLIHIDAEGQPTGDLRGTAEALAAFDLAFPDKKGSLVSLVSRTAR